MAFLFRWAMRAFLLLSLVAFVIVLLAYYLAQQSLPEYDRDYVVAEEIAPFEIVRDRFAIPHILSGNDHDAFFGLGFVHAQDRLWQMMLSRRAAQGRLSELFGRDTFDIDVLMRALDVYGSARMAAQDQDAPTTAALEAYADGVNAWLHVVQEEALGRGAPEYFLFEAAIAPWTPVDSIAVQKLVAMELTDKAEMEALRARLSLHLPPERVEDLLPQAPNKPVMGLPDFSAVFPQVPTREVQAAGARHRLDPLRGVGDAGASNTFAVTGARTAGRGPLLASDPHLPLQVPAFWYLARMDLESGPVMGATIPGIPAVILGRSARLAWGMTSSYLDDQDIYIERLDPENPEAYFTPEGFVPFETREATIGVRGAAEERVTLRRTRHGPVIPGAHFGVDAVTPEGHVASLAWTALSGEDRTIGAMIGLMRSGNVREARAAARDFLAPSSMLSLADSESVALQMIGRAPRRLAGHTSRGLIPAPGWLAANDWQGLRPPDENPWVVDPPSGAVVNTNNRITDAAFPDHVSHDWGDAFRILRAGKLLGEREYHSLESFVEIQTDTVSAAARTLLPLMARDLWYKDEAAEAGSPAAMRAEALERLADWNGDMHEHEPEPLIYAAWLRALQRRLVIDELGALTGLLGRPNPMFIERVFRDVGGASVWCDVRQSRAAEGCAEVSRRALDDALLELKERFGGDMASWRWGDAHEALHVHPTLGTIPVLRTLVNIRQSVPGGDHTLRRGRMAGTEAEPYLTLHGAGYRGVYDFADPDSSVFVISSGQSGHLLSRHYDDMASLWRRGEYVPMSLDADLARAGAVGVMRMRAREE